MVVWRVSKSSGGDDGVAHRWNGDSSDDPSHYTPNVSTGVSGRLANGDRESRHNRTRRDCASQTGASLLYFSKSGPSDEQRAARMAETLPEGPHK